MKLVKTLISVALMASSLSLVSCETTSSLSAMSKPSEQVAAKSSCGQSSLSRSDCADRVGCYWSNENGNCAQR